MAQLTASTTRSHATLETLRNLPYLACLADDDFAALLMEAEVVTAPPRTVVLHEGGHTDSAYVVLRGRVRLYKRSPEGREQALGVRHQGDSFNEAPVFDGGLDPTNVVTLEPTELLRLPGRGLRDLTTRPPFARAMLSTLATRLRLMSNLVGNISFHDVVGRTAFVIAQLAETEGESTAYGVAVRRGLKVREMASMIGAAREGVSRAMARLENQGLIAVGRHEIVVRDMDGLRRFVEEHHRGAGHEHPA